MADRHAPEGSGLAGLVLVVFLLALAAPHAAEHRGRLARLGLDPAPPGRHLAQATTPAPDARTAQAVAFARAQLGKPYQWGAEGPGAFDCSGLTSAAWAAAGIRLPRTARAQFHAAPRVARAELRPGDLVFYRSSGPSGWHVALYAGHGRMVEALGRHAPVRLARLRTTGWRGAVRPQGGERP
jgi:cell wall-associated NlpC family hydrolase